MGGLLHPRGDGCEGAGCCDARMVSRCGLEISETPIAPARCTSGAVAAGKHAARHTSAGVPLSTRVALAIALGMGTKLIVVTVL